MIFWSKKQGFWSGPILAFNNPPHFQKKSGHLKQFLVLVEMFQLD
jgi:hypothetical protein